MSAGAGIVVFGRCFALFFVFFCGTAFCGLCGDGFTVDEEEFVGTGEVVRIEKTEEVTDVAKHCYQEDIVCTLVMTRI